MRRALLVVLVFVTVPFHPAAASDTPAQSPNLLFQLQKQNRSHPWLRVATDSVRLTLVARRIDELGLHELTAPRNTPLPHDPLLWSEINRIDEVVTRAGRGGVIGSLVLGLSGAGLGNALGAPQGNGGNDAMLGFVALASVGGFLGAKYGERFKHERNWYVADPDARSAAPLASAAAPASTTPLTSSAPLDTVTAVPPASGVPLETAAPTALKAPSPTPRLVTSKAVLRASNRIGKDDVIRVTGSFGSFQGYADLAGPAGLEGLHRDPRAKGEWARGKVPERISWEEIEEVRMRGGSGTRGGLMGAASFGAVGALFGMALIAVAGDGEVAVAAGALYGAGVAAPFGLLFGAGAGALVRRWVVVYQWSE